jgi:hypothetical protein
MGFPDKKDLEDSQMHSGYMKSSSILGARE